MRIPIFAYSMLTTNLLWLGCASSTNVSDLHLNPCDGADLVFFEVLEEGGPMAPGVSFEIRSRTSVELGPPTDDVGRTCVSRNLLLRPDVLSAEFCKAGFHCGAFRIEEERSVLPGTELKLLMLAPKKQIENAQPPGSSCPDPLDILLRVEDPDGTGIPDVRLYRIGSDEIFLGTTDRSGHFCIAANHRSPEEGALLACRNAFFCGLIPASELAESEGNAFLALARFGVW